MVSCQFLLNLLLVVQNVLQGVLLDFCARSLVRHLLDNMKGEQTLYFLTTRRFGTLFFMVGSRYACSIPDPKVDKAVKPAASRDTGHA